MRRLLSHTAGLTDGLGYAGFEPGAPMQSLEDSLTRPADASPGASGTIAVGYDPGSEWEYSGGGYAILQLLIEEVSGESFEGFMQRVILLAFMIAMPGMLRLIGVGSLVIVLSVPTIAWSIGRRRRGRPAIAT